MMACASLRIALLAAAATAFTAPRGSALRSHRRAAPLRAAPLDADVLAQLPHASTLVVGDLSSINAFQKDHTFLEGIIVSIVISLVVKEIRRRIEKPIMDEVGRRRVADEAEPAAITTSSWAKLVGCVVLDLLGDTSELIPFLGEFTDIAYAPVEASVLKALFQSNTIAAFGFVEEILPFTDVIPTFTLSCSGGP
ncbi:hypothetical protein JL720_16273 [Aureococcus anophagefferens]|nr:hypothetical protein JL720_16273 [Aureococcus anophagefferens]